MSTGNLGNELRRAAAAIKKAKALFVTAGAGMGVDSGLPDFRGPEGFWRAYPPLKALGLRLEEVSNPSWFHDDPIFAWGFFGHRYNLYAKAVPHRGYGILLDWAKSMDHGCFVFTSNVDGHFLKAGYDADRVVECHGSIHFLQSANPSSADDGTIWPTPADAFFDVCADTLRLKGPLPQGPPGKDDQLARPNILMFDDFEWVADRTGSQRSRFEEYKRLLGRDNVQNVVVEIGAGLAVPTVRYASESLASESCNSTLIRINPLEAQVPEKHHISIPMKGLEALEKIDSLLNGI